MVTSFQLRRGTAFDWAAKNPILRVGEMGYEIGTYKYKIGDGVRTWNQLPYFIDEDTTRQFIVAEVALLAGQVSGVTQAELDAHIASEAPHPNYEDGADFTLLYNNAKV